VFGNFNGDFAFYLTLAPITLLLLTLYFFKRQVERAAPADTPAAASLA
jgi:FHS family glucose/mannose:H+ symporter-like MFS transporter